MISRAVPFTRQPAWKVLVNRCWTARGLKLAILPSLGWWFNLSTNLYATATTNGFPRGYMPSGMSYSTNDVSSVVDFAPATLSVATGLTFISIWRSRPSSDYNNPDGDCHLLSSRDAGNGGWSWGRNSAGAGGGTGNLTQQTITFQGVAHYDEGAGASFTIESKIDTPVCMRWSAKTGLVSWFRFGKPSSADTAVGTPSAGGTLIIGDQGPYPGSGGAKWRDQAAIILAFDAPLTDNEIFYLTNSTSSPWAVFGPQIMRLPSSVAAAAAAQQDMLRIRSRQVRALGSLGRLN